MMYEVLIQYAEQLYNMPVKVSYSEDKNILFLHTFFDDFKIYLQDKERFDKYTVSHKNKKEANGNWHVQIKCNSFDYAIYTCLVHGFNKAYSLWSNTEDYYRFRKDALKAWNYG